MSILKQLQSLKIHPSGWPVVALLCMGGFLIGAFWEAPILVMVGSIAVGIYLFRFQTPTIPTNQGIITAPVSGKISAVEQISSPDIVSIPPRQYLKIGIRCGLFYPASLHALTSIKIKDKQKLEDASSRKIMITATTTDLAQNNEPEELILVFSSVIPRWYPECDVEINDTLSQGQVFGFLSFGGQLDLYVPSHFSPLRIVNQTCIAGETILAKEA